MTRKSLGRFSFSHMSLPSVTRCALSKTIDQGRVLLLVSFPQRRKGYRGALYRSITIARTWVSRLCSIWTCLNIA